MFNVKAVLESCEKVCNSVGEDQTEGKSPEDMIEAIRKDAGVSSAASVRMVFRAYCLKHDQHYSLIKGKNGGFWNTKAYIKAQAMKEAVRVIKGESSKGQKNVSIAAQLAELNLATSPTERAESRRAFSEWRKAETKAMIAKEVEALKNSLKD